MAEIPKVELERLKRDNRELDESRDEALRIRDHALQVLSDLRDSIIAVVPQHRGGKFSWEGTSIEYEANGRESALMANLKEERNALSDFVERIDQFEIAHRERLGNLRDYGTEAVVARKRREELTRNRDRMVREEYLAIEAKEQGRRR